VPKCLGAELSGHFGTSAEVSWCRSVLDPKCPVTVNTTSFQVYVFMFSLVLAINIRFSTIYSYTGTH